MSFTAGSSRWSDVWLAATARGTTICGDFLAATALALALQGAGAGGLAVSGLLLAATLPLVVLAPLTGRLVDRVDSRTLLVTVGLAQAVICALLAVAEHPMVVVGLVALLACGLAVTQPCLAALLPAMVRPADLPRASAISQNAVSIGALGGPVLAGLLVGQFGTRVPLLLDAVTYLALVVAGLLLRTRRGGRQPATAAPGPARGEDHRGTDLGWRLRRDPLMLVMVVSTAVVIAAIGGINVIEVFFIRETLGGSATTYGLVGAAWMAGMLPGSWLAARLARRFDDDTALIRGVLASLAVCSLLVLLAAGVPTAGLLVPLWLVAGAANGGENVFANLLITRRVPEAMRGRAYAGYGAAVQGGSMAGYLLGGVLLTAVSPRPLIAGAGLAGLLVVSAFAPVVARAVRRPSSGEADGRHGAGLATPSRPAEPEPEAGDTVGSWLSASHARGSGTSSS
ncbi:MFS transporter [Micromonospora chokoriensis]|uniref:MFS-type transporter involved in bile tolerance, Atg22 family n=1 Tax=Micromonospora chokoriensis TaxID=356851 RepID=A0A1C4UZK6_9ACTN|nr:MFS transporter [Micromonospora chokoriensis]SCE77132.1 MFS-type transporter involved in bile tolerance, Atg22 family [Micromonospora chokoriensis]